MNVSPPGLTSFLSLKCDEKLDMDLVCLRGFLEIVVLRRLTEPHQRDALALMDRHGDKHSKVGCFIKIQSTSMP